jgi:insertion element IS1 protein InsB
MIAVPCRKCGSTNIAKNGHTKAGTQKYYCKACGFSGSLTTKDDERAQRRELIEKLHLERVSQRGIARLLHISRTTIISTLKKKVIQPIAETIQTLASRPTLELDELWSYVGKKANKVWIWLAIERETRRIVGIAFGDRSDATCRELWASLPADYRKRASISTDYLESYANIIPSKRLHQVGKESGETAHIERFNNTLRQRCANLVRKTLSFSKDELLHQIRIRLFIDDYNLTCTSQS